MKTDSPAVPAESRDAYRPLVCALLFGFVALLKTPDLIFHPRFWAEEGSAFFSGLQGASLGDALRFTYSSYLLLPTSVIVWLATLVPLPLAPLITTLAALLLQAGVAALIGLWAAARGIAQPVAFLLVGAWALLPATYETWATMTNAQWTFAVAALFLLLLPPDVLNRAPWPWRGLALLIGLSGIPGCVTAPGFLLAGLRSRPHLWLGLILSGCAALQAALLFSGHHADRAMSLSPSLFLQAWAYRTVAQPLIGGTLSTLLLAGSSAIAMAAITAVSIATAALIIRTAARVDRAATATLAGLWLLATGVGLFAVIGDPALILRPYANLRYFLFGSMCLCALLALSTLHPTRGRSAKVALGLICALGVADRILLADSLYRPFLTGPAWRAELSACRSNQPCDPAIWPDAWGRWSVPLPPRSNFGL